MREPIRNFGDFQYHFVFMTNSSCEKVKNLTEFCVTFSFCRIKKRIRKPIRNCGDFEHHFIILTNSFCYQQNQKLNQRQ
jgi:hypothetical protein